MPEKRLDEATRTETVGHEWDGIEELNTPLPRWWLWTFYACIVFALGYSVAYPAWPMLHSATAGVLGWSSRGDLAGDLAAQEVQRSRTVAELVVTPIQSLPGKPALMRAAVAGGAAAFKVNCVQCHGAGAAGSKGFPNLADDDWLWGGDLVAIEQTLLHGIRQPGDDATRQSIMPAFGADGLLTPAQINAVVGHVLSLSGKARPNPAGATLFADNCAVCHGPAGKGRRAFGAPDLTDAIWLDGGTREDVAAQIARPHMGVMPAWGQRLDLVTIKMLAAYVHSLGGGEAFAPVPDASVQPEPVP